MTVKFTDTPGTDIPGSMSSKVADAELHFTDGVLAGLKLVGFAVWRRKNGELAVTFPARQYSINGERRSFFLLRPIVDPTSNDRLRDVIIEAYKEHESAVVGNFPGATTSNLLR